MDKNPWVYLSFFEDTEEFLPPCKTVARAFAG